MGKWTKPLAVFFVFLISLDAYSELNFDFLRKTNSANSNPSQSAASSVAMPSQSSSSQSSGPVRNVANAGAAGGSAGGMDTFVTPPKQLQTQVPSTNSQDAKPFFQGYPAAWQAYPPAKKACETQYAAAANTCLSQSPLLSKLGSVSSMVSTAGSGTADPCDSIANASNAVNGILTAYSSGCTAAITQCLSACAQAQQALAKVDQANSQLGANTSSCTSACPGKYRVPNCPTGDCAGNTAKQAKCNADCTQEQSMQSQHYTANAAPEKTPAGGSLADLQNQCSVRFREKLASAASQMQSLTGLMNRSRNCDNLSNDKPRNGSGGLPSGGGAGDQEQQTPAPTNVVPAGDSAGLGNTGQSGNSANGGRGGASIPGTGSGFSALTSSSSVDGKSADKDAKSSEANQPSDLMGATALGAGGGNGVSVGYDPRSTSKTDVPTKASGNAIDGGGAGAGKTSSYYGAYLPGAELDPHRRSPADELEYQRRQISSASGQSNWEKIHVKFNEVLPTLFTESTR